MSCDVIFNCHYKGRFVIVEGVTIYKGGEVNTLECEPQSLIANLESELGVSMYRQRVWYKLPYENMTELKLLFEGSNNFQKMYSVAFWNKEVEIFMEENDDGDTSNERVGVQIDDARDEDHNDDRVEDENDGDGVGIGEENILYDVVIDAVHNDERIEEEVDHETFEEDQRIEEETGHEMCKEDQRVEEVVAAFVDDEENYDYHDTPVNSDSEDAKQGGRHETYVVGSGELKLMQVFDFIPSFKEAVVEYVLKEKYNVRYTRWGKKTSEVRCFFRAKCPFKVYCSFEEPIGMYMIKIFVDGHICTKDNSSRVLSEAVMAKMFLNDFRRNQSLKPTHIQQQVMDRYNLTVSYEICKKSKSRILRILQKEFDEQFSRLKDYKQELLDTNPGSTVELGTITNEGGLDVFDHFYVCFETLKRTWRSHCRPIFGIDGCFLKCDLKGQMLAAVGRDANNQFYPVAWAIVQVENKDNWLWFIKKLKTDLNLGNGEGFTLISDRHKGLLIAVDQLLPKVEHRMCARHIYGNIKSKFSGRSRLKKLFWAVAESFNKADYNKAIAAVESYDLAAHKVMMEKNPENCSRAYFTTTACCEDVHNNFSESYNNAIDKARAMPLVEMLETIRRQTMRRIDLRNEKSLKHQGKYTPKVAKVIQEEEKKLNQCTLIRGPNGQFEVLENGISHAVTLPTRECKCRRWEMTGIPCRHALKVLTTKKLDPEDYVSDWYLTTKWQAIYSDGIKAVNGMHFWIESDNVRIKPPERQPSQGPKKKQKRIKGKHESPKKKGKCKEIEKNETKATKGGRVARCGHCRETGHNIRKCKRIGVDRLPKNPVRRSESMDVPHGEGPSQPSQNSKE